MQTTLQKPYLQIAKEKKKKNFLIFSALFLLLSVSCFSSLFLGSFDFSMHDIWDGILNRFLPPAMHHSISSQSVGTIVWELRIPRMILAALVGALLSCAGASFQGLLRNPLADPYIAGISSAAAVGGAAGTLMHLENTLYGFGVPGIAFLTAMAGLSLVYSVARRGGQVQVGTFLLAGVAVGSALWSIVTIMLIASGKSFSDVLNWLMGSFADPQWGQIHVVFILGAVGLLLIYSQAGALNAYCLGEETAKHLGVRVEKLKRAVLIGASILTAVTVAYCGIIGFVGLIVPHIGRRLFGADHKTLFISCILIGPIITVWSDVLARMLFRPIELPVGVITALIGTPFFLIIMKRSV